MVFESIIRIDIMICFPSGLTKFFLCNYFTHTFHKDLQDDKLLRRKTEIFPMKVSPSSFQVNFEAVSWNKNRCALWTIFPKIASCDSCDMSQTTLRVQDNTAIQIVVSARKQNLDLLLCCIFGCNRQNRHLGKSAQAMDQLDTIYIWKT